MAKFTYIGETADGTKVRETVKAEDRFAVYEVARQAGHTVSKIDERGRFSLSQYINVEKINYYISRVGNDELVMVTRNLGSMLDAGLPLTRALSVIERQSSNPRLKGTLQQIQEHINKGDQFNESLAKFPRVFNDLYVAMARAGEEGGDLSKSLHTLSSQLQKATALKKRIKGAMIYPAIVITVMVIIGILMMLFVMPTITETFESMEVDLPTTTQFLIAISEFMAAHTLIAIGGLVSVVVAFSVFLRTQIGTRIFAWIVVRLPVIGTIAKEVNAARTARTLSSLLGSGVDVLRSLEITQDVVQNPFYKAIIAEAQVRVEKGSPLSEVFIENEFLYPVLVGEMILVGEETGQISNMLEQLADFYETEVDNKTKDLSTIIEPVLMVAIGGGVGFFALAVIAPIYSITETIQ